jgi:hypothetical protein
VGGQAIAGGTPAAEAFAMQSKLNNSSRELRVRQNSLTDIDIRSLFNDFVENQ